MDNNVFSFIVKRLNSGFPVSSLIPAKATVAFPSRIFNSSPNVPLVPWIITTPSSVRNSQELGGEGTLTTSKEISPLISFTCTTRNPSGGPPSIISNFSTITSVFGCNFILLPSEKLSTANDTF